MAIPTDVNQIEAPVTFKAYLMCAFAAFAGIFFGFDTGYINGTMAMKYFIHQFTGLPYPAPNATASVIAHFAIPAWRQSLIVSILSAGTFTSAVAAGDCADFFGRRTTIIASRFVILWTAYCGTFDCWYWCRFRLSYCDLIYERNCPKEGARNDCFWLPILHYPRVALV